MLILLQYNTNQKIDVRLFKTVSESKNCKIDL